MTDLEITRLCAIAYGISVDGMGGILLPLSAFDPLHDDAQAMALVKKFKLDLWWPFSDAPEWHCADINSKYTHNADLNRAICECVAKMQAEK